MTYKKGLPLLCVQSVIYSDIGVGKSVRKRTAVFKGKIYHQIEDSREFIIVDEHGSRHMFTVSYFKISPDLSKLEKEIYNLPTAE